MLRQKCNRPMLLIERQKAMLLEVYKCIHELGPLISTWYVLLREESL